LIKKTQIVNLRILTQTFVSIFLDSPHDGHRHESILLRDYTEPKDSRKIFIEEHSPYPYYICALIWYMFEKHFQEEKINTDYKKYKAHLYLIFRMSVGEFPPKLTKSSQIVDYCSKLLHILREDQFAERLERVLSVFDSTQSLWVGRGKSRDSIKDRKGFTELMLEQARENFISREYLTKRKALQDEKDDKVIYEGIVLNIIPKNDFWFGFIPHSADIQTNLIVLNLEA